MSLTKRLHHEHIEDMRNPERVLGMLLDEFDMKRVAYMIAEDKEARRRFLEFYREAKHALQRM